ncbi:hypothetical protein [Plantactinospora sp. B5E13]|uniref:hypothetical protein n=1 Tax=unclassified Plantactinospora TaxID=2631981 RepID=UPI00325E2027
MTNSDITHDEDFDDEDFDDEDFEDEDFEDEDDEEEFDPGETYVAVCPVDPELARQVVELAELNWDDRAAVNRAVRGFGWRGGRAVPVDEGRFVTAQGHVGYGHDCLYLPFAHCYQIDGEVWTKDFWGSLPGWSSEKGAYRPEFDGHVETAVARFTELLGPPESDVRVEGRNVSVGSYSWRYAAWRRGGNVIVVGQTLDGFSYSQYEEAVVYIGRLSEEAPLPEGAEFRNFLKW